MTGQREAQLLTSVNLLLDARRTAQPIADLPADVAPATLQESFFIQDQLIQAFGTVGGWKVGPPADDGALMFAPMPSAWMAPNAATLSAAAHRFRGIEAEVAFLLGEDLPPRTTPYTLDEIKSAIQSCHPAIEILESGLTDPTAAPKLSMIADLQMHGGFVYGPAHPDWQSIDFATETVTLAVDAAIRVEHTSTRPANFFLGLVLLLANEGAHRTGGLRGGQFITTGSWTGVTNAMAGQAVDAHFGTLGRVTLSFQ